MEPPDHGPSILPRVVLWAAAAFVALTLVAWIVGAVLAALRFLALVTVCVAVIWALVAARRDRR